MDSLVVTLLGLVAVLFGVLLHEKNQKAAQDALKANADTKEKVDELQKGVDQNNAQIASEDEKQKEAKAKLDEEKAKDVSKDDLLDFFNNGDNKPK